MHQDWNQSTARNLARLITRIVDYRRSFFRLAFGMRWIEDWMNRPVPPSMRKYKYSLASEQVSVHLVVLRVRLKIPRPSLQPERPEHAYWPVRLTFPDCWPLY